MVNSNAIWNDVLEVGTAEKTFESKDDRWWIITLFGMLSLKLEFELIETF